MNGAARSYDLGVELAEDFVVLAGLAVQPILERQQQQRLVDVDARRRRADRDRATAQRNRTVGARSRSRLLACWVVYLFLC
jgi:heme exporter protein D